MTRLTAIVPATNRPATLTRCTEAIRSARDPAEEILIVETPPAAGPAQARNSGARRASGEVLVFVDADMVVRADAFTRIRAAFEDDPDLVALFGSYDDSPEAADAVSRFRNLLHHYVHQSSPGPAATFWAGLGAIRRDSFMAAGGFDERFRVPSVEDIDLGMRLAASGERIVLDPLLQGTHLKAWSLAEMIRTDFARRGVPWIRLLLRDRGRAAGGELNLGWPHRLSALACLVGIGALLLRRPRTAIAMAIALVAINSPFYRLLGRYGLRTAVTGVGLHAIHHLTAAAAVPAGVLAHLLDDQRRSAGVEPWPDRSGPDRVSVPSSG
jgi:GT2 family glycosyltransferase